ncbi:hypothetical protein ATCM_18695 [Stenotrophomonas sp. ATCM1_4]|jgi:hypothetical protein|uniref:Uncharacterized protein n=1 Tax=Stenotrophomonas capsici TaxID=3110230 RepID=A0ABU5V570_9GAMM|nr:MULTISPECIES: hypothetical protein [unclassified Stenotrophomonas]MEA5668499.1 hypothetical protein [Stenotrophomonas sp. MH1]TDB29502.1 hypothetical protein ATCM_18695 [Stenotrophomonas sp. ATCM1_4]
MSYENLQASFDSLAQEIVVYAFALRDGERKHMMRELCLIAGQIAQVVQGRADEVKILCALDGTIHRANSMVNAVEQCENIRERTARHYLGNRHTCRD